MDDPKMGIVFTSEGKYKELLAIPLTLAIGWKNSPSTLFTVTETVADIEN